MNFVIGARIGIYLVFFLVLIILGVQTSLRAQSCRPESPRAFWPPDMVPHPMPPEVPKQDDGWTGKGKCKPKEKCLTDPLNDPNRLPKY